MTQVHLTCHGGHLEAGSATSVNYRLETRITCVNYCQQRSDVFPSVVKDDITSGWVLHSLHKVDDGKTEYTFIRLVEFRYHGNTNLIQTIIILNIHVI